MRPRFIRFVMMGYGLLSLAVYGAGAYLTYLVLRMVWINRPSAAASVGILAAISLVIGYVSYRSGTARLLATLPVTELSPRWAPELYRRLDRLVAVMAIDRPRVFISDLKEPNAFAMSSPSGGVIVVDLALMRLLTIDELEAIIAHELAHLESHDSLIQLLAFTSLQTVVQVVMVTLLPALLLITGLAKAAAWFRGEPTTWAETGAWQLRGVIVGAAMIIPAIVTFVLLVRSRRREYAADARATTITGNPLALARALRKVDQAATAELTLRALLSPHDSELEPLTRLLATHPATANRIKRLLERGHN